MRNKRKYKLITFRTTAEAMAMEKFCGTNNIPGRLIPVPREISAGCGLAWRMLPEDFTFLEAYFIAKDNAQCEEIKISVGNFEIEIEQMMLLEL